MKKISVIILFAITTHCSIGQIFNDDNNLPEYLRKCKTGTMPLFPGGQNSLDRFIADNLKRPSTNWCGQGKVHIKFKVDSVGHIGEITVLKGIDFLATQEALRVVGLMPTWIPATCDGKCIDLWYSMPIKFVWH